jgi:hypothetical protein
MAELLHPDPYDAPPPPSTPRTGRTSVDWAAQLIGLLGKLDALRDGFAGRRLAADSQTLIVLAEEMVQAAEDLAGRTQFPDAMADAQTRAMSKAGAFFTAVGTLKKPQTKSLVISVYHALRSDGPSAEAVRDCLLGCVDVLNAYFSLFTDKYKSSADARGWVDAASAFLTDFKQLIKDLPAK